MDLKLTGKAALVTGSSRGIGLATAKAFAAEGCRVMVSARSAEQLREAETALRATGAEVAAHAGDVGNPDHARRLIEATVAAYGGIDILVNNVGGSAAGGVAEMLEENFDRQIDYNLKSVFLCCRHVIPIMVTQGGGAIVNTASTSGIRYTGSPQIGYASAKAAVIQFSRVTAVQYASKGIRVNTVVPGQMHTPMVEARLAKQRTGGDIEALLKSRVARIPLGFMGDGRDTAHAVLFLASDEARFITGTEIVVDGGMTARCD